MTTFSPEIIAGARAIYERQVNAMNKNSPYDYEKVPRLPSWEKLQPATRDGLVADFAAGLTAFADALLIEGPASVTKSYINHITGRDA